MTAGQAIQQIERCHFECEGGYLENNAGYRWVKERLLGVDLMTELFVKSVIRDPRGLSAEKRKILVDALTTPKDEGGGR